MIILAFSNMILSLPYLISIGKVQKISRFLAGFCRSADDCTKLRLEPVLGRFRLLYHTKTIAIQVNLPGFADFREN